MITARTYQARRAALTAELSTPAIFTGNTAVQAKADMAHKFVQEASFSYLTGINEPDWKVVYDGRDWWVVAPDISETKALFDGSTSLDEIKGVSGIERAMSEDEMARLLGELRESYGSIATLGADPHADYYEFSIDPSLDELHALIESHELNLVDCRSMINKQRAIKTDEELAEQQQAINLTVETFAQVKKALATYHHEYEIEADFNSAFRKSGAGGHAYEPIIAGANRACTLHYVANQEALPENGLVLLDVGAQVNGYAADVTRTYAMGTPSEREVAVHAAVERALHEIIAFVKPGGLFKDYQAFVDTVMKRELISLGLIADEQDSRYRTYFPHAISHGLGIDVHESLGGYTEFKPGMVFTIEPGIYIPEEGIGVRIEDDILVTETGTKNMSGSLPTSL